jgi:hypothetical protein
MAVSRIQIEQRRSTEDTCGEDSFQLLVGLGYDITDGIAFGRHGIKDISHWHGADCSG